MKSSTYMTRALRARDPRYALALRKLGYSSATEKPSSPEPVRQVDDAELDQLRAEYLKQKGEEPDKRWGATRLKRELGLMD
ncbi:MULTISPECIES: hypothetical protein [unclassified Bradyrhizobium]